MSSILDLLNMSIRSPNTEADLTYIIYKLLKLMYVGQEGNCWKDLTEPIRILESVKLEFYMREVAVYEDKKIFENGDI